MASVTSQLIEGVTAHAQWDSLEDAPEICTDGTYFPNNLHSCGDVTVTVQTFIATIISDIKRVSAYNSHKISSSSRTFLCKAMIATEGKQREYLNEWSLFCSLMVLKIRGHDWSVYL